MQDDRQLQKALLGNLFLWYEKGNSNLVPVKQKPAKVSQNMLESLLPPVPASTRNRSGRNSDMSIRRNPRVLPQSPLGRGGRNFSQADPLMKGSQSSRNVLGRRGNSVAAPNSGIILSPNDSNYTASPQKQKTLGMKRNSEMLPRLVNQRRHNNQSSLSTQIETVEEQ